MKGKIWPQLHLNSKFKELKEMLLNVLSDVLKILYLSIYFLSYKHKNTTFCKKLTSSMYMNQLPFESAVSTGSGNGSSYCSDAEDVVEIILCGRLLALIVSELGMLAVPADIRRLVSSNCWTCSWASFSSSRSRILSSSCITDCNEKLYFYNLLMSLILISFQKDK